MKRSNVHAFHGIIRHDADLTTTLEAMTGRPIFSGRAYSPLRTISLTAPSTRIPWGRSALVEKLQGRSGSLGYSELRAGTVLLPTRVDRVGSAITQPQPGSAFGGRLFRFRLWFPKYSYFRIVRSSQRTNLLRLTSIGVK